ncbi:MAG: hypothetical protein ACFFCQ_02790, partial [Promethearchaeota archaeon]
MLQAAFLMVFKGRKGPQIVSKSTNCPDDINEIQVINRLSFKALGLGQERPPLELAGPITDEEFPECKILFYPLILKDPETEDVRIKDFGAVSSIFLVFPSQEMNEILQAYDELSRSLKVFVEKIETTTELIEQFRSIEGIVNKAILRSALNQVLDELMLDRAFKDVFVIAQDGSSLALASRSRGKDNETKRTERVGAISALSISERVFEALDYTDQSPLWIGQAQNETIVALKIPEGGIVASLEKRAVTFRGLDEYIDALRETSLKISSLLKKEARGLGLFSMIREMIPEVQILLLSNTEGVVLASENVTGKPEELASMASGFYSTLVISGHESREVGVIEGKDSYVLMGELRKDNILLITVPKRRKLDE